MYYQLTKGTAELFGTELAPNQPYTFSGTKAAPTALYKNGRVFGLNFSYRQ